VRLMKHVDNPTVSTKTHRDIIVDHSSAMYMNVKLVNVCQDGSQTGIWVPTLVLINHVLQVSREMSIDTTAKWWKMQPTSVYSSELYQGVACLRSRLKSVEMAITMFSKYQIAAGIPIC
jgi:hypothetical protein